jgi:hypothetical protein
VTDRDKENNLMLAGVQLGGRLVLLGGETATAPATAAAPATGQQ